MLRKSRHTIRLKNWDYSSSGYYFVTICTHKREPIFGEVENEKMVLNETGEVVNGVWNSLPRRFGVHNDAFQIMPNHMHFITQIVGAHHDASDYNGAIHESPLRTRSLLPRMIGYLKMNTSKSIHKINPNLLVWQRNYYEYIMRNEIELMKIREYIKNNPQKWEFDRDNPKNWETES